MSEDGLVHLQTVAEITLNPRTGEVKFVRGWTRPINNSATKKKKKSGIVNTMTIDEVQTEEI